MQSFTGLHLFCDWDRTEHAILNLIYNFMKKICIALCIFLAGNLVRGQVSNVVFLDSQFKPVDPDLKVPFSEKILLKSTQPDSLLEKLKVTVYYGANTQTVEAGIKDGNWEALIGPFEQKQRLIIRFQGTGRQLQPEDWNLITDALTANLVRQVGALVDRDVSGNTDNVIKITRDQLAGNVPEILKHYVNASGQSAYDAYIEKIEDADLPDSAIRDLVNTSGIMVHSKKKFEEQVGEIRQRNLPVFAPLRSEINTLQAAYPNDLKSIMDSLKQRINPDNLDSAARAQWINLESNADRYDNAYQDFRRVADILFQGISLLAEATFTYTLSAITDVDVNGITRYVGFDMGELFYQRTRASYGTFVLVSPFLKATDPEDEITLMNLYKDTKPSFSIIDVINPTFGMALVTVPKPDTPALVWFAGGSLRFNKWVRFVIGDAFLIEDSRFHHHLSCGVSINFLQLGNFLQIIGGAGNYVNKTPSR